MALRPLLSPRVSKLFERPLSAPTLDLRPILSLPQLRRGHPSTSINLCLLLSKPPARYCRLLEGLSYAPGLALVAESWISESCFMSDAALESLTRHLTNLPK